MFVIHVVNDHTGREKFVTADANLTTCIEVLNSENLRGFDYAEVKYLEDGKVVCSASYLPIKNLTVEKVHTGFNVILHHTEGLLR